MEVTSQKFKVVVFQVGNEEFGLHVERVVSIERMQPITVVPKMPEYVAGVINLRGIVTPIIDLRKALLQPEVKDDDRTRIIIARVDDENVIGLIVDAATDVLDIPSDSVQKPNFSVNHDVAFLLGVAKLHDRLLILIDINQLLRDITSLEVLKQVKNYYNEVQAS